MRVFKKRVLLSKQPWINKRRRERSSRHDISQTIHIPVDLTFEILSRLPAKSILRFRCVSKLWSSLTRLPSFINSFTSRSPLRPPRLLVNFSSWGTRYVISFPQNQNSDGSYPPFHTLQIKKPRDKLYARSKSVEGLILLPGFSIWNPTLRKFSALPHPNEQHPGQNFKCYLGYDPLEGKHKVLCILYKEYSEELQVLTLGAKESWRVITKGSPIHCPTEEIGECFNGILYYKASLLGDDKDMIMSFDVKSESFSPIKCPEVVFLCLFHMILYEGRLALLDYRFHVRNVDLYILEDADGHEWTHRNDLYVSCKEEWADRMYFMGTTDDGEFVFAPFILSSSYYILYFDPRRNSTREALFQGCKGEIRRHGPATKSVYIMNCFTNHIESLVSL